MKLKFDDENGKISIMLIQHCWLCVGDFDKEQRGKKESKDANGWYFKFYCSEVFVQKDVFCKNFVWDQSSVDCESSIQ